MQRCLDFEVGSKCSLGFLVCCVPVSSSWRPGDVEAQGSSPSSHQAAPTSVGAVAAYRGSGRPGLGQDQGQKTGPVGLGVYEYGWVGRAVVEGGPSLSVPPTRGKETTT
jgi:hypothetical protein